MQFSTLVFVSLTAITGVISVPIDDDAKSLASCRSYCGPAPRRGHSKKGTKLRAAITKCEEACELIATKPVRLLVKPYKHNSTDENKNVHVFKHKDVHLDFPLATNPHKKEEDNYKIRKPNFLTEKELIASLITSIRQLRIDIQRSTMSVRQFQPDIMGAPLRALDMLRKNKRTSRTLREVLYKAKMLQPMSSEDSGKVIEEAARLMPVVKESMDTLIEQKPKFQRSFARKMKMTTRIADKLEAQSNTTKEINKVLVSKLSPEFQASVPALLNQLEDKSEQVLHIYRGERKTTLGHKFLSVTDKTKKLTGFMKRLKSGKDFQGKDVDEKQIANFIKKIEIETMQGRLEEAAKNETRMASINPGSHPKSLEHSYLVNDKKQN